MYQVRSRSAPARKRLFDALPPPVQIRYRLLRGTPDLRLFPLLCDRDRVAVDVGANIGLFVPFLQHFSKRCYAFEPNPDCAKLLRERFGNRLIVEECALSDRNGSTELFIPEVESEERSALGTIESSNAQRYTRLGMKGRRVPVRLATLDSMNLPPVGFVKIDAEGHELDVLQGARALLERDAPNLYIEAEERHSPGTVSRVHQFCADLGYSGFFYWGTKLFPVSRFDARVHQAAANVTCFAKVGEYANDFLFTKQPTVLKVLDSRVVRV